ADALEPHHWPCGGPDGDESALEVGGDHYIEILIIHAQDQAVLGDARVVDQYVEPPMRIRDFLNRGGDGGRVSDIARQRLSRPTFSLDLPHELIELFLIARDGDDVQTVLREARNDRRPYPARPAGDKCDSFFSHLEFLCRV